MNAGRSPIVERIGDLLADAVRGGRLRATTSVEEAVMATEVSIVSVGTPSSANGRLSLDAVERVSREIGQVLKDKAARHLVVMRRSSPVR